MLLLRARVLAHLLRTKWAKSVRGGVSRLTRDVLRSIFLGDESLARVGVELPLGLVATSPPTRLFVEFQALVGDEESLSQMWHIKSSSGICPCAIECGVVNKQNQLDRSLGVLALSSFEGICDISCQDLRLCTPRADEDVWAICDELARSTAAELKEKEHKYGIKWDGDTLLYDIALRSFIKPSSANTFDPMHVLFSNGL